MSYLYLVLLVCSLGIQDSAAAFFHQTTKLPSNRLWLTFNYSGETARVKLSLSHLRKLAHEDSERAEKELRYIERLPQASNPLLAVHLLFGAAFKTKLALNNPNESGIFNFSPKLDGDWLEGHENEAFAQYHLEKTYSSIKTSLFNNKKLLQMLSVPHDDMSITLTKWISPIANDWRERTHLKPMLDRNLPEELSHLAEHEDGIPLKGIEALMAIITEKLQDLDTIAADNIIQAVEDLIKADTTFSIAFRTDNYSEAYYYQAVAEAMLHTDGLSDSKEAQLSYLASDLMKVSGVYAADKL